MCPCHVIPCYYTLYACWSEIQFYLKHAIKFSSTSTSTRKSRAVSQYHTGTEIEIANLSPVLDEKRNARAHVSLVYVNPELLSKQVVVTRRKDKNRTLRTNLRNGTSFLLYVHTTHCTH